MLALLATVPAPELAVTGLVAILPLGLALLCWPLVASNAIVYGRSWRGIGSASGQAPARSHQRGLSGQWLVHAATLETAIARQSAAIGLHRGAATHLGALDHEIDRLWRETRALTHTPADWGRLAQGPVRRRRRDHHTPLLSPVHR